MKRTRGFTVLNFLESVAHGAAGSKETETPSHSGYRRPRVPLRQVLANK